MDPDMALESIRTSSVRAAKARADEDTAAELDALRDLRVSVESLDHWLTRGGFLPADWATPNRS